MTYITLHVTANADLKIIQNMKVAGSFSKSNNPIAYHRFKTNIHRRFQNCKNKFVPREFIFNTL